MAVDSAKQPDLIRQTPGRSEVATSADGDKLAKLETTSSPQCKPESWHLPRAAQLVPGLPLVEAPTTIPNANSFERERWVCTPFLRRTSAPSLHRAKFLLATATATVALLAGYFAFTSPDEPVQVSVTPDPTIDMPVERSPVREAGAAAGVESQAEPEGQKAPLEPADDGIEARLPPTLPEKKPIAASQDASTCFPSASAVRQNRPGAWPSWTLRAPGHEGIRCWYAATRATSHDHR